VPRGVALHTACFPHPLERDATRIAVANVVPSFLRELVLAWRDGYLAAADPAANEQAGPGGAQAQPGTRAPLVHYYREGFRARRNELLTPRARRSA
jgi:hypothetical protein